MPLFNFSLWISSLTYNILCRSSTAEEPDQLFVQLLHAHRLQLQLLLAGPAQCQHCGRSVRYINCKAYPKIVSGQQIMVLQNQSFISSYTTCILEHDPMSVILCRTKKQNKISPVQPPPQVVLCRAIGTTQS
jgi:hypothetical protein